MKILILILCFAFCDISESMINKCSRNHNLSNVSTNRTDIDVFWINLDRSVDRRLFMLRQLGFYGLGAQHRIKAVLAQQIYIPTELSLPNDCLAIRNERLTAIIRDLQNISTLNSSHLIDSSRSGPKKNKLKIIVQAHCGRKKNTRRELAVTLSHLFAIRSAIYDDGQFYDVFGDGVSRRQSNGQYSPYALILEDDLQLAFEVDFPALIKSSPNPISFGILQLVTSNEHSVQNLHRVYTNHRTLWVKRKDKDDYWCAGAYIINKPVLKPIIDAIFVDIATLVDLEAHTLKSPQMRGLRELDEPPISSIRRGGSGKYALRNHNHISFNHTNFVGPVSPLSRIAVVNVVAGYQSPCWPKFCCRGTKLHSGNGTACVHAARGYQADHYIYSLAYDETYMLTVPIVTGATYGNTSTLHQDHVSFHVAAFNRINSIVSDMVNNDKLRPTFLNKHCMFNRTIF